MMPKGSSHYSFPFSSLNTMICNSGRLYRSSPLIRRYVHLEIATNEKQQPRRAFCDDIIRLKKQIACVKKAVAGQDSWKNQ
ncbi:hypothetical protein TNCV_2552511 [Trichonephila clavipes]|nr:hypothetical protein TNCV_2552511 [Trichonephila clavipes]